MAAPTPILEDVISAIQTLLVALPVSGTVKLTDRTLDSEYEDLDLFKNATTAKLDLWRIECESVDEEEEAASGEHYSIYNVIVTYTNVRLADDQWSKKARLEFEAARDELNQNAGVFAIAGQRQLRTPETVNIRSHGFEDVEDQKVYKAVLALQVEARRFG